MIALGLTLDRISNYGEGSLIENESTLQRLLFSLNAPKAVANIEAAVLPRRRRGRRTPFLSAGIRLFWPFLLMAVQL